MNAGSNADHISNTPDVAKCNGNAQMNRRVMYQRSCGST